MEVWRDFERGFVRLLARGSGKIVARAATQRGARKPVAWVVEEFFLGIADELEQSGVSRRVASGMFGVSRRTYLRKVQAAESGVNSISDSLWWSVLQKIREAPMVREDLLAHFSRRSPELIGAILFDMLETNILDERDGVLHATEEVEEWSDERLLNFINMLEGERELPPVAELAATLGVDEARIEEILAQPRTHYSVRNAEQAPLFKLLGFVLDHGLVTAYRELGGESVDAFVYRVGLTGDGKRHLPKLQEAVVNAREQMRTEVNELLEEHGTRSDDATTFFTALVSHLVDDRGWLDRPGG